MPGKVYLIHEGHVNKCYRYSDRWQRNEILKKWAERKWIIEGCAIQIAPDTIEEDETTIKDLRFRDVHRVLI
jgi:hypothetical protein